MKMIIKLLVLPFLLLFSTFSLADSWQNPGAEISKQAFANVTADKIDVEAQVKASVQAFMKENNIPGMAVELYIDGKPYSFYFGYANREKKIPVTKNTIFEIGSISKIMTSILLAQQVDVAKVNLNDSAQKYIAELPESFADITFLDLATHTSGLPFNAPNTIKTRPELARYLTGWSPEEAPQDQWVYSNFGIGLIGYALENITHRDFNQLYRKRILSPLGMHDITVSISKSMERFYAQGYDQNGKPIHHVQMDLFPAAGAIKASAQDMLRFLSAAIGLPGTPPAVLYPMRMTQAAYIELPNGMQGLGWQIYELNTKTVDKLLHVADFEFKPLEVKHVYNNPTFNGNDLLDKTGLTGGFRSYIALVPNKKSGIVFLANRRVVSDQIFVNKAREILFKFIKVENEATKKPA